MKTQITIHFRISNFFFSKCPSLHSYLLWAETSWLMWDAPVGVLKRADLSGDNATTIVQGGLSHVTSIAVNDIKRLVYWADNGKKLIEQTSLDGSYRKRILDTKVSAITAITICVNHNNLVDPGHRYLVSSTDL